MQRQWHDLHQPASRASLYLRAAGKRRITGDQLPMHGLRCTLAVQPKQLHAYRQLCRFVNDGRLPATYPHIMAFNLQLQLMTAEQFPFPLLGLVHLHNRIDVIRPLGGIESLRMAVHADNLQPHPKGGTFDLVTEAADGIGVLWRETSRMLVRGLKLDGDPVEAAETAETAEDQASSLPEVTRWYADSDIGRRYAKVCGDYNPIHLSAPSAQLFGFPTAIAHGMWSKAMAMAALHGHLPHSGYWFEVDFHKPVRLPSEVVLSASQAGPVGELRLDGQADVVHMLGRWACLQG